MKKASADTANGSAHGRLHYYEAFDFEVVHEDALKTHTDYNGTSIRKEWLIMTRPFKWHVVRPEAGVRKESTRCPYCGKVLFLPDVYSVEKCLRDRARFRVYLLVGAGVLLACVPGIVLAALQLPSWYSYFSVLGAVLTGFVCFANLIRYRTSGRPDFGRGTPDIRELSFGRISTIEPPPVQHYIKTVNGR